MPAALADTLDEIRAKGVIMIGTGVGGTKPWMYQDADGSYAGMEYEMLQYIMPKLGVAKARSSTERRA